MKKLVMFLGIGLMSFMLMGCEGSEKNNNHSKKENAFTQKQEIEVTGAKKVLNNWIKSVLNDYDYESQFDTDVFTERSGEDAKLLLKKDPKIKIFYSDDKLILVHVSLNTERRGCFALVLENNQ